MGDLHKLYPTTKDLLDGDIFLSFKKQYQECQEEIFQTLIQNKQLTIITHTGQEIVCSLQQFYGKNHITNPYGHEYHILLESENKRFGCHIEHRMRMNGDVRAQGLYPSSRMVNNKKIGRVIRGGNKEEEQEKEVEKFVRRKLSLA